MASVTSVAWGHGDCVAHVWLIDEVIKEDSPHVCETGWGFPTKSGTQDRM
jgi:hypothetical protein